MRNYLILNTVTVMIINKVHYSLYAVLITEQDIT